MMVLKRTAMLGQDIREEEEKVVAAAVASS